VKATRTNPTAKQLAEKRCALLVGAPDFQSGSRGFSSLATMDAADQLRFIACLPGAAAKADIKERRFSAGLEVQLSPTKSRGLPPALSHRIFSQPVKPMRSRGFRNQ
jgi:hypothetical protein